MLDRAPDRREPQGRGRLLQPPRGEVVRAALRLGVAAEARRGTARLGRPGREEVVREPEAARGADRRPATSSTSRSRRTRSAPASTRTPRSGWRSPTTTPGRSGDKKLQELIEERAKAYYGEGRGRPGPVGAGRGGLPLAEPVRGRPDAPRAAAGRVPRLVPQVPARARRRASRRRCSTPATVTDRTDPQLVHLDGLNLSRGVVHAGHRRGAAGGRPGPEGAGRRRPRSTPRRG